MKRKGVDELSRSTRRHVPLSNHHRHNGEEGWSSATATATRKQAACACAPFSAQSPL
jgi:hypothetical protein